VLENAMTKKELHRQRGMIDGLRMAALMAEHYDGRDPNSCVTTQHKIAESLRQEANALEENT